MPGDPELERLATALVRWNAIAIVLQANAESTELGGHIASYQSAETLYEVGFNHFWRARSDDHLGDLLYIQGHSSPGIYARAFLEGRLSRRATPPVPPGGGRGRTLVVPPPVADARLLAVPDRLDGPRAADGDLPGALHEVPLGARDRGRGRPEGLGVHGRRRDGRAGVDGRDLARRPREARQPRLRRQLQPAAARRPRARQRQDHPGARDELPRRGLERHQGDLGLQLGHAARRRRRGLAAPAHGGGGGRRVPDVQGERRRVRARALLREVPRDAGDGRGLDGRGDLGAPARRPRPAEGLRGLPTPRSGTRASRR